MPKTFRVMEAWCGLDPGGVCGKGKVIATGLTEKQADDCLERLYAPDRHWWKEEEDGLPDLQGKPS